MKTLSIATLLIVLTLSYSKLSFSQGCVVTGTTPDNGEVVVCSGLDTDGVETTNQGDEITVENDADLSNPGGDVIETLDGDDYVEINGGMITGLATDQNDCVSLDTGTNELIMTAGTLRCGEGITCDLGGVCNITIQGGIIDAISTDGSGGESIFGSNNDDEIYISGGAFTATDGVIQAGEGDDKIIITGGTFKQLDDSDETIDAGRGNDHISVSYAIIDGTMSDENFAIDAGNNDDTIKLGTGAEVLGIIDGAGGFDTLVFEMAVTESLILNVCARILGQDPEQGEVTVNGLFYVWEDFEEILCELVPAEPRPIPALSQWGLIAMAGVFGIIGLLAIRRKRLIA